MPPCGNQLPLPIFTVSTFVNLPEMLKVISLDVLPVFELFASPNQVQPSGKFKRVQDAQVEACSLLTQVG